MSILVNEPQSSEQEHLETDLLIPTNVSYNVQNYTAIAQDPETGHIIIVKKEKKAWLWTSESYIRSLLALAILFLVFTALEYTIMKFNLPAMNPYVFIFHIMHV